MTDIVKRLRSHPGEGQTITVQFRNMVEQRHDAAAEIERLREHIDALLLVATSHEPEALRQQAEIERLRATIRYMRDHCLSPTVIRREVRRALEHKP